MSCFVKWFFIFKGYCISVFFEDEFWVVFCEIVDKKDMLINVLVVEIDVLCDFDVGFVSVICLYVL